ncbi:MAG: phosphate/phosphite/phosphonate ABC transporter substrate-binding protein [Nitrospinae bacterium]|nr:phosphate/phosphite/phosphonate ABC transporter substrate-binding protein [Nitrospinota bacterium]
MRFIRASSPKAPRSGFKVVILLIFSFLVFAAAPLHAVDRELRVAFIPLENPEKLISNVKPAMDFLEKEMGRKIRYFITLNYSAAVEAMISKKADVSFMSPLPYVLANKYSGVEAVLGEIYDGKSYYYSRIFVRKDSGIKKLSDLKGKTIAYVDPISSSGFMYPHDIFTRAGLVNGGMEKPEGGFFRRVYFAGGDQQAINSVVGGFVAAAGVSQYALNLLRPEQRDQVVAIAQSAGIPSHNVVVRKGLEPEIRRKFIAAMMKMNRPENRGLLRALYGTDGYVKVDHSRYQPVADMARKYGFLKE